MSAFIVTLETSIKTVESANFDQKRCWIVENKFHVTGEALIFFLFIIVHFFIHLLPDIVPIHGILII